VIEDLLKGGDPLIRELGAEPASCVAHLYLLERLLTDEAPAVPFRHPFRRIRGAVEGLVVQGD
jgi:hypothetical protein